MPDFGFIRPASDNGNAERLVQHNTELTPLFRPLGPLVNSPNRGGFGLYRPVALVYLQT